MTTTKNAERPKNAAAVELVRLRHASLSAERRSEIARMGGSAFPPRAAPVYLIPTPVSVIITSTAWRLWSRRSA